MFTHVCCYVLLVNKHRSRVKRRYNNAVFHKNIAMVKTVDCYLGTCVLLSFTRVPATDEALDCIL